MHAQMFLVLNIREFVIFRTWRFYTKPLKSPFTNRLSFLNSTNFPCETSGARLTQADSQMHLFPPNRESSVAKQEIFVCALNWRVWILLCAFLHFVSVLTPRMKLIKARVEGFPVYVVHTHERAQSDLWKNITVKVRKKKQQPPSVCPRWAF